MPLDASACIRKATDAECGGMVVFIGVVRNETKGKKVVRLEYECYQSMALKELKKITVDAARLWGIKNMIVHHRTGILEIGDIAVVIVINAKHRQEAFEACRYAIDTLKKTVPIWKKEIYEDGEEWVDTHP